MVDSELLRKFVAVAEELNFSRAARRLGIAQPPLSRAVQQLERRLGVPLLNRDRPVSLTLAGEVLLAEGRKALTALEAAEGRTRRASRPRLVLVTKPGGDGGLLTEILPRYAERSDALEVDLMLCGIGEQEGLLRDGSADVAILHLPHDDPADLATEELLRERQVVVVPRTHRLAGHVSVRMADLASETFPRWTADCAADGPLIRDSGQVSQLIAVGRMIAVLPESVRHGLRRDLVTIPVEDAEPTAMVLAWPEESRSRALAAFVRTAAEVAAEHVTSAKVPMQVEISGHT